MPNYITLLPFYAVSFVIGVFLPVFIILLLVSRFSKPDGKSGFFFLLPFLLSLNALAISANILWEIFIFNHVYYEWDRFFLPYTFIWHEAPVLDISPSWLARGWTLEGLHILWLSITLGIYIFSALVALLLAKRSTQNSLAVILRSVVLLTMISLFFFLYNSLIRRS